MCVVTDSRGTVVFSLPSTLGVLGNNFADSYITLLLHDLIFLGEVWEGGGGGG